MDVGDRDHQGDICKSGETHTKGGPWWGLRGEMLSDRTGSGGNNSVPSHGSQGTESHSPFCFVDRQGSWDENGVAVILAGK